MAGQAGAIDPTQAVIAGSSGGAASGTVEHRAPGIPREVGEDARRLLAISAARSRWTDLGARWAASVQ